jgi:hemolysin III
MASDTNISQMSTIIENIAFKLEHSKSMKQKIESDAASSGLKLDNRLFPQYLLYCEGMSRPSCRGKLHLLCACIFPFLICLLYSEANGNLNGKVAALFYGFSALFCYTISSLYHIVKCSAKTEILLQKLDHCSIAIYACGTNIPTALLLLPFHYGFLLAFLSIFAALYCCWFILVKNKSSVWKLIMVASCIVLFWPILFFYMNYIEYNCMVLNAIFAGIGAAVFINRFPDPYPSCFGYHEVFHFLTVITCFLAFFCNWSIIRRTCNPYARFTDIFELLYFYAFGV